MTRFAFGAKWGARGASGASGVAAKSSGLTREASAAAPDTGGAPPEELAAIDVEFLFESRVHTAYSRLTNWSRLSMTSGAV